jgi:hypothetical protein
MTWGECDISDVVEQWCFREALTLRQRSVFPILGDYKIDVATNQKRDGLGRVLLGQYNAELRADVAEALQRKGCETAGSGRKRRYRDLPKYPIPLCVELRLSALHD